MRRHDCCLPFLPIAASPPALLLCQRKLDGSAMTRIKNIETGHYRIPLPVTLSDSTHGEITAFELMTVPHPRCRRRRRRRLHLYRRPQWRRGRRHPPPRDSRTDRGPRGRRHRGDLASHLVGPALWRPRRTGRAGALGARHRAVGPEGAPRQSAAVAPARRLRCPRALLRRRHRPRSLRRGAAASRPTTISPRAFAPSR